MLGAGNVGTLFSPDGPFGHSGNTLEMRCLQGDDFLQSLNKSFPIYTAADNIIDALEAGLGVSISV